MDSSCDFGIDFHRKINAFCSQNGTFFYTLARKSAVYYKNHQFPDENRSQNRMKNPSKIIKILIYVGNV